jgi:hypothetical protein
LKRLNFLRRGLNGFLYRPLVGRFAHKQARYNGFADQGDTEAGRDALGYYDISLLLTKC